MKYQVTITATTKVIYGLDTAGAVRHSARLDGSFTTSTYLAEGTSSAEVIDQVFAQLERVTDDPAGVRVSVRPVEVVKP